MAITTSFEVITGLRYLNSEAYSTSTGILAKQKASKRRQTKQISKQIVRLEEHAERYKNKLRQKFGYMQQNVGRNKQLGKMLKNRLGTK